MRDHDWQGLLVCYEGNYILNQINHITVWASTKQIKTAKTKPVDVAIKPNPTMYN